MLQTEHGTHYLYPEGRVRFGAIVIAPGKVEPLLDVNRRDTCTALVIKKQNKKIIIKTRHCGAVH